MVSARFRSKRRASSRPQLPAKGERNITIQGNLGREIDRGASSFQLLPDQNALSLAA
jgi:hypothetical protein